MAKIYELSEKDVEVLERLFSRMHADMEHEKVYECIPRAKEFIELKHKAAELATVGNTDLATIFEAFNARLDAIAQDLVALKVAQGITS